MLPEFVLTLRPNNQISLSLQNVSRKARECYQKCLQRDYMSDTQVKAQIAKDSIALARYRYYSEPLDIIQKSQHGLESFNSAVSSIRRYLSGDRIGGLWRVLSMLCCRALAKRLYLYICEMIIHRSAYHLNKPRCFGTASGQKILESGAVIEMLCGTRPEFCHCTTLTLPANHWTAFECLAARSGDCVNRLFQIFRRRYKDVTNWFFVWEFQKRGALHLHICHYHPDTTEGQWIGSQLIEQWHKILADISEETDICMFSRKGGKSCTIRQNHQHHTQPMVKGCGRYFAKYALKASKSDENNYVREYSKVLAPTRFWGSSRSVKELVKENSIQCRMYAINGISERKYTEMEEEVLELEVTSYSEYSWKIEIQKIVHSQKAVITKNEIIPNVSIEKLVVSEGKRATFYVSPVSYQILLKRLGEPIPEASIA